MCKFVMRALILFASLNYSYAFDMTGNSLYMQMQSASSSENVEAYSYIFAVTDYEESMVLHEALTSSGFLGTEKKQSSFSRDYFCMPANVTGKQVFDIVHKYLEMNPETRHQRAVSLIRLALIKVWPCGGNPKVKE